MISQLEIVCSFVVWFLDLAKLMVKFVKDISMIFRVFSIHILDLSMDDCCKMLRSRSAGYGIFSSFRYRNLKEVS